MPKKKPDPGLASDSWVDPDDAPELTEEFFADAEVFEGDKFVRRGRGRPPTGNAREIVSFRLDRDLLAKLREAGPGWQSRVNGLLRNAIGLPLAAVTTPVAPSQCVASKRPLPAIGTPKAPARPAKRFKPSRSASPT